MSHLSYANKTKSEFAINSTLLTTAPLHLRGSDFPRPDNKNQIISDDFSLNVFLTRYKEYRAQNYALNKKPIFVFPDRIWLVLIHRTLHKFIIRHTNKRPVSHQLVYKPPRQFSQLAVMAGGKFFFPTSIYIYIINCDFPVSTYTLIVFPIIQEEHPFQFVPWMLANHACRWRCIRAPAHFLCRYSESTDFRTFTGSIAFGVE